MRRVYGMLEGVEKKVGEPLLSARASFEAFLKSVPKNSGGISYARNLLEDLRQFSLSGM